MPDAFQPASADPADILMLQTLLRRYPEAELLSAAIAQGLSQPLAAAAASIPEAAALDADALGHHILRSMIEVRDQVDWREVRVADCRLRIRINTQGQAIGYWQAGAGDWETERPLQEPLRNAEWVVMIAPRLLPLIEAWLREQPWFDDLWPVERHELPRAQAAHHLPWLALPSTLTTPGIPGSADLSSADKQAIGELLNETLWLLLVADQDASSLAPATAIARLARQHGSDVVAFMPADAPEETRRALLDAGGACCLCPPTVPLLIAAEVLWSSVMCQGVIGIEYADLRGNLDGLVTVLFTPLRQDGPDRVRALLSQLEDFVAERTIWAVFILPDCAGLDEFTEVGDFLHAHACDDTTVVIAMPLTDALPYGLYLFIC